MCDAKCLILFLNLFFILTDVLLHLAIIIIFNLIVNLFLFGIQINMNHPLLSSLLPTPHPLPLPHPYLLGLHLILPALPLILPENVLPVNPILLLYLKKSFTLFLFDRLWLYQRFTCFFLFLLLESYTVLFIGWVFFLLLFC